MLTHTQPSAERRWDLLRTRLRRLSEEGKRGCGDDFDLKRLWIFGLFLPSGSRVKTTSEKCPHYGGWFLHLSGRGANRNRGGLSWLSAFDSQPSWQEVTSRCLVLHVHIVDWLLCVAMGKASRHNSGLGKKKNVGWCCCSFSDLTRSDWKPEELTSNWIVASRGGWPICLMVVWRWDGQPHPPPIHPTPDRTARLEFLVCAGQGYGSAVWCCWRLMTVGEKEVFRWSRMDVGTDTDRAHCRRLCFSPPRVENKKNLFYISISL